MSNRRALQIAETLMVFVVMMFAVVVFLSTAGHTSSGVRYQPAALETEPVLRAVEETEMQQKMLLEIHDELGLPDHDHTDEDDHQ